MSKVKVLSEDLNNFVNKYFVNMDFSDLDAVTTESTIAELSVIEKAMLLITQQNYDDNNPELWFNRELCLRALVILTQLEPFSQILVDSNYIQRAFMLLARVVESFNKKIAEDPEIIRAIQENRLDEELERYFPEEMIAKRSSNFIELVDESELATVPENYQPIPENF